MENILTLDFFRLLFTVLSFAFGIYQYFQRKRLEQIIASEAVELHNNIAVTLGACDKAIDKIDDPTQNVLQIRRAHGLCQAVLQESAKLYCNLKHTDLDDIDALIVDNQLPDQYRHLYYAYSEARKKGFGKFKKRFLK